MCGGRIRLVGTHRDLSRNPPGLVGGGVREGLALFSQSQLPKGWCEVLGDQQDPAPAATQNSCGGCTRCCHPSGASLEAPVPQGSSSWDADLTGVQPLLLWLNPHLIPTSFPQAGEQQQLGVGQHRTGQHRVTRAGSVCSLWGSSRTCPLRAGPAQCPEGAGGVVWSIHCLELGICARPVPCTGPTERW